MEEGMKLEGGGEGRMKLERERMREGGGRKG